MMNIETQLSPRDFLIRYQKVKRPVVVRAVPELAALSEKWQPAYFATQAGDTEVMVNYNRDGFYDHMRSVRNEAVTRQAMPLHEALTKIEAGEGSYYLQQLSIDKSLPRIKNDLPELPWLGFRRYVYIRNLWIGAAGCITPLHFDHVHNFLLQVSGKKTFVLYPPQDSRYLYVNPKVRHTSMVDLEQPDLDRHPLLLRTSPMEITLEAGDLLYMPPRWWHHVRSLETNISVNIWWNPRFSAANLHILWKGLKLKLFPPKLPPELRETKPTNAT